MDFVSVLPKSLEGYDSIWVIVDRMTKSAHFLHVTTMDPVKKIVRLYLMKIMWLHGVTVSIVSDRDARFTLLFWRKLQAGFGTRLKFSIARIPKQMGKVNRRYKPLKIC